MSRNHSDDLPYPPPARRPGPGRFPSVLTGHDALSLKGDKVENLISPAFLLWIFRQWWRIGIPVGMLMAVVAGAYVMYSYVPVYEASALLMIEDASPYIAFPGANGQQTPRYIQTQLELFRSPVVLEPVVSRTEIASLRELSQQSDRVSHLRSGLSVRQVGGSEMYTISYISADPPATASVANAVVAEYMSRHDDDEFKRSQRVIDLLEEERARREVEIKRLRQKVVELAKDATGRDPFGGRATSEEDFQRIFNPAGALFQGLTQADVDKEVLTAELRSLTESNAASGPSELSGWLKLELDLEIDNDDSVRQLQRDIKEISAQMVAVEREVVRYAKNPQVESNATYSTMKSDLEARKKDLAKLKDQLRQKILEQRNQERAYKREQKIADVRHELVQLETRKQLLSRHFRDQVSELQLSEGKSVELEFARTELEREENVFELIAQRKLAKQTELRAPARILLLRKAEIPTVPLAPIPYKLLLLACSAALCTPFALALMRETLVRRVTDVEQLAQESHLRVLGEVATLPVRYLAISPRKLSGKLRRDTYIYAESINSLRTNLALTKEWGNQKVLAVASAISGEGKTSIATSLARSIANATEMPTLIIDADMRSPDVANMLQVKNQPGLCEVLSKKCQCNDAIQRVGETNLYVIPAGRATKSPHHLVSVDDMEKLLDQLRTSFSTIIVDTPPILGASESLVLAKSVDAVLFCSLCDVSRVKQVRIAMERLEHAGVDVVGAVLSGTPARRYEYVYGYYAPRADISGSRTNDV